MVEEVDVGRRRRAAGGMEGLMSRIGPAKHRRNNY